MSSEQQGNDVIDGYVSSPTITPVTEEERFLSLDFIRGIAVFGILLMNVQVFGNVFASYVNPTVNDDFSGINQVAWFFTHIFIEQKFYTIFSMLFGAGIVLMAERATLRGVSAGAYHYRRSILLLIFGLCHGFFIWYGDILTIYGFFALLVFGGWQSSPRRLIVVGIVLTLMVSLMMLAGSSEIDEDSVREIERNFFPSLEMIEKEVAAYRGSWIDNQVERVEGMITMLSFLVFVGIRIAGCMLIGMALYKLGIINGKRSTGFYRRLSAICLVPGLIAIAYGANLIYQNEFKDAVKIQMLYGQINFLVSLPVALGYIGLFHLFHRSDCCAILKKKFEAVGQMAFTNYILQSVVCTSIFYGFGFGLFSSLERFEMLVVAVGVFLLQLFWSDWWLSRFRFGPIEWLWRSLVYFKLQRLRV
ncbi:DUF418 domain-containing protein [Aliikangiella coralliicola]|uniref:DUF418 domain-containing protein n=1 Tax=Aliikangiella coralliicola TaxID=2592383 RepID=A0A545UAD3_9GAMM|nr:DUF418 domain-containing protein [Aliikangiella coralliicola]TQV86422.1 DUF418 domain-containing protein [Aliikangiella coralliicola]